MLGYILSGVGFALALICFILYYREYRHVTNELTRRREAELEKRTAALLADIKKNEEKYAELEKQKKELERQRLYEQDRAREARDATERLLKAEHERAAAELGRVKEIEELKLQQKFKEKEAQLEAQFNFKKIQFVEDFNVLEEAIREQLADVQSELNEYQAKRAAINEQLRREKELQNEIDYHRIILTENDKEDIKYLISIENHIHHKEILYKLIWSEYIQKAFTQTLKNILGNRNPKNVIYCIENIATHKKYIGKTSAEVSKRWIEHIKNSLNIGGIKRQPIHDALFGHWDEFTFSILEEVKDNNLNEREKYYIHFFETDKYGYNVKAGG